MMKPVYLSNVIHEPTWQLIHPKYDINRILDTLENAVKTQFINYMLVAVPANCVTRHSRKTFSSKKVKDVYSRGDTKYYDDCVFDLISIGNANIIGKYLVGLYVEPSELLGLGKYGVFELPTRTTIIEVSDNFNRLIDRVKGTLDLDAITFPTILSSNEIVIRMVSTPKINWNGSDIELTLIDTPSGFYIKGHNRYGHYKITSETQRRALHDEICKAYLLLK